MTASDEPPSGYPLAVPDNTKVLGLRVSSELVGRLDKLVERFPGSNRHALARVALERGLDELEREHPQKRAKR
jgi:hypothetical protein